MSDIVLRLLEPFLGIDESDRLTMRDAADEIMRLRETISIIAKWFEERGYRGEPTPTEISKVLAALGEPKDE